MARFTEAEIAQAIGEFVLTTEAREVPAAGRNGSITVYGENPNPYKPVIEKGEENEPVQTPVGEDIGLDLGGLDSE